MMGPVRIVFNEESSRQHRLLEGSFELLEKKLRGEHVASLHMEVAMGAINSIATSIPAGLTAEPVERVECEPIDPATLAAIEDEGRSVTMMRTSQ